MAFVTETGHNDVMHFKGSVKRPVGQRGYLCGAFLKPDHPPYRDLYWEKAEVAYMYLTPDSKDEMHYHKHTDKFLILIRGRLRQEVEGEEVDLTPGEFLFIKAGARMELLFAGDGTELIVIKAPSDPKDKTPIPKTSI